jgi:hypothetical protein
MTISLGVYDVFSYIVPGFLYLYVITEFMRLLSWRTIDLTQIDTVGSLLLVTVISFVLGHIIGSITYNYWSKLFSRTHPPALSLARLRELYPDIQFDFKPDDNELIFAVISHHDKSLAEKIETARVNSIMLRSISLGLFLYGILQIWLTFDQQQLLYLAIAAIAMLCSAIALRRSITFYKWFFTNIFLEALNYGSNVHEVLATSKNKVFGDSAKERKSQTSKK